MNKKYLFLLLSMVAAASAAFGQTAIDAYRLGQPDMKGTARFMSMGGAFGALGGDLSSLSQNPAGIGVYRSSEIGFTLDLDCQSSATKSGRVQTNFDNTRFYLNNIGGVLTMRLNSKTVPNINFGFTYNKSTSYNRHYGINSMPIGMSMTNYIAGLTNSEGATVADLTPVKGYDPYNPTDGGYVPQWLSVLGYAGNLIAPTGTADEPTWVGQYGDGTHGSGSFEVEDRGCVDSYNIALGGNISNLVYWGMDFDITSLNFKTNTYYGEQLTDAYVNDGSRLVRGASDWNLVNQYQATGTGFNYKLGFIVKPIQELRIGFAFHTPTWYNITETYRAWVNSSTIGNSGGQVVTNDGYPAENSIGYSTPWRIIASAAGVIGGKFIVSADYEWAQYSHMKYGDMYNTNSWGYYPDYGWDYPYEDWYYRAGDNTRTLPSNDPYYSTNMQIRRTYEDTNTLRVGAEYRINNHISARVGYSYVSSPVKAEVKDGYNVMTAGTMPNFRFDNSTNYICCGLGYRVSRFYVDLAYVWKHMTSTYHAFTGDSKVPQIEYPTASVDFNNSQIVMSAGFRF